MEEQPTPTLEETSKCTNALMPLQMWIQKECGNALREIKRMQKQVWALLESNTRICKMQIKQQKELRALKKKVKELEVKP